jgi:enoyl-CoA hydratase
MADQILRERRGHIEIITINRPEVRNAIDHATSVMMSQVFDEIDVDDDVWVVILTASGEKAFSSGMDLKAFSNGGALPETPGMGFAGICERKFSKPLIAAVNGAALAGGFELVLACDLVVASSSATFGVPEVTRGLFPGAGGLIRLPKRIPRSKAWEMALTGQTISAEEARDLGLVNYVVAFEEVLTRAIALAETIAQNAPLAVKMAKQVLAETPELPESQAWVINNELLNIVRSSNDAREGATAFAEKRPPRWSGS